MNYDKNNPESIQKMFDSIATKYDRANALLSLYMHRIWNQRLIREVLEPSQLGEKTAILDLCCGTGDIALTFLKNQPTPQRDFYTAHLLDFSAEMLVCARQKADRFGLTDPNRMTYLQADAQEIPLPDHSIDRVTLAYGIRNVQHRDRCFEEIHRVLRSGGRLGILELTRPQNPVMRLGHKVYLKTALPLLGRLVTSNEEAYRYLCRSIHAFATPEELTQQLQEAGFTTSSYKPLMGGIATLIMAQK